MKQSTLFIVTSLLVIVSGCTKHVKRALRVSDQVTPDPFEQEYTHYRNRGIILATTGSLAIGGGATAAAVGTYYAYNLARLGKMITSHGTSALHPGFLGLALGGAFITGGGISILYQGLHDLARANKLRRMRPKQIAQQKKP